ncbi:PAS domain-containing protein, partial [Kosakonia cowanii]
PRRKAEGALRHSEERFTRTFQMAPVPMAIGARDGHLLCEVNASFTQMTGYASTEIIGRPLGEVELWEHSTMREEIEALIEDGHALRG